MDHISLDLFVGLFFSCGGISTSLCGLLYLVEVDAFS